MKVRVVLLFAAWFPMALAKQMMAADPPDSAGVSATLQVTAEVKTPFLGGVAGRAQCDDLGNIYFRPRGDETSAQHPHISALPIRKVRSDGSPAGAFSIADVSAGLLSIDFFVAGSGEVYQAARSESEHAVYVVSYSPDGSLRSKSRLEGDFFVPYRIAAFRSGEVLVSGIHGRHNRTPFTAVYTGNGKLIKEIYEPEDEDARKRAEAGELGFRPDNIESSNDFVVRGDIALGSDDNVYLLRAGTQALIYVISHKGEVVRKLRIASPDPSLSAERLRSAPGMLAISFLGKGMNTGMIELVDYEGRELATYAPNDKRMYPGMLSCYASKRFTFLELEKGGAIGLETAEAK